METDYSDLNDIYFMYQIKKNISYHLLNLNKKNITDTVLVNKKINLNLDNFKYVSYNKLFNIEK
jgi:hypothetical protein